MDESNLPAKQIKALFTLTYIFFKALRLLIGESLLKHLKGSVYDSNDTYQV